MTHAKASASCPDDLTIHSVWCLHHPCMPLLLSNVRLISTTTSVSNIVSLPSKLPVCMLCAEHAPDVALLCCAQAFLL